MRHYLFAFLLVAALILFPVNALGQWSNMQGATEKPPAPGQQEHVLYFYDGSNRLEYNCWTQTVTTNTYSIAASTLTNIVDATNTATVTTAAAHGLTSGATVTVSGASDTDLNGTYVITVTASTTFTFTSANVTDATYTDATLSVVNTGPKDTAAIWAIQKRFYTAGGYLAKTAWADGTPAKTKICANRASINFY